MKGSDTSPARAEYNEGGRTSSYQLTFPFFFVISLFLKYKISWYPVITQNVSIHVMILTDDMNIVILGQVA